MWEFLRAGGPVMFLLVLTSVIGLAFIIERGFALRWGRVIPKAIDEAVERCNSSKEAAQVINASSAHSSPMGRLLLLANGHLDWSKQDNVDSVETAARHEVICLERG